MREDTEATNQLDFDNQIPAWAQKAHDEMMKRLLRSEKTVSRGLPEVVAPAQWSVAKDTRINEELRAEGHPLFPSSAAPGQRSRASAGDYYASLLVGDTNPSDPTEEIADPDLEDSGLDLWAFTRQ